MSLQRLSCLVKAFKACINLLYLEAKGQILSRFKRYKTGKMEERLFQIVALAFIALIITLVLRYSLLDGLPDSLITVFVTGPFVLILWFIRIIHKETDIRTDQRRLFAERFRNASTQLGSDKVMERIGGLFELEALDREAPSPNNHGKILDVIQAFIRSSYRPQGNQGPRPVPVPEDLQSAIRILGRRQNKHLEKGSLNLSPSDLRSVCFDPDAHFEGVNLKDCWLNNATMNRVNLQGAILTGATYTKDTFTGAFYGKWKHKTMQNIDEILETIPPDKNFVFKDHQMQENNLT